MKRILPVIAASAVLLVTTSARRPPAPATQQPSEISTTISSDAAGSAPRFAVPDFIALSRDAETIDAAQTMGRVLWDDLNFEREFLLIPKDVQASVPAATSLADVPFDRWREVNADGVIVGTVQKTELGVRVEVRLFNVRSRQSAFARGSSGCVANKRLYAHTIADEIHQQQRQLRGVARTKLTFNSDRDGERMTGTVESRGVKEIYISDYDGENQRRVTTQRSLNITSTWSPDGRSIAYTSYGRGAQQSSSRTSTRAPSKSRRRAPVRTGCQPGRRMAPASRSVPPAMAIPSCMSRIATAECPAPDDQHGNRQHADLVAVQPESRSRRTAPARRKSTSSASMDWACDS